MEKSISFIKYLLFSVIGFGIAGLLWGWSLYHFIGKTSYPLTIWAAIFLAVFGGLGLTIYTRDTKKILKVIGWLLLSSIIGAIIVFLGSYHLPIAALFISSLFFNGPSPDWVINFIDYLALPGLGIFFFWINFLILGSIVGISFAFSLRIKLWPMIWRGGVGFALGSFIGPIVGNLIGGAMGSLLATYLITFFVISVVFGKFLAWGIYKNLNPQK